MAELIIKIITEEVPFSEHKNQKNAAINFFKEHGFVANAHSSACTFYIQIQNFPSEFKEEAKVIKGPKEGVEETILAAFAKRCNANLNEIEIQNGFYTYKTQEKIIKAKDLIINLLPNLFNKIASGFSKSLFWNGTKQKWIRPIIAISIEYAGEILPFEYAGIKSSFAQNAEEVNEEIRIDVIKKGIKAIEESQNVACISSEKLINENAFIASFPSVHFAHFDSKYLKLPEKVVILSLEKNQKYFLFKTANGQLSNIFGVCINGKYSQEIINSILEGNKKVLSARLEDAIYYVKIDTQIPLLKHFEKLKKVVFHKNAGSVFARIQRMQEVAKNHNITSPLLEKAILFCKADLQTEMVQSFTELQGYIAGYYATLEGMEKDICDAISHHYEAGFNEEIPFSNLTYQLSFVEKYEKIESLLLAGEEPTSSRDPFGIRKDALALLKILTHPFMNFEISPSKKFKTILIERLQFLIKNRDDFAVNAILKNLAKSDKFSVVKIFAEINFLEQNKASILEYKRVFNILSQIKISPVLEKTSLDEFEIEILEIFSSMLSVEKILNNATKINDFFAKYLIIDESNQVQTSNRLYILNTIYNCFKSSHPLFQDIFAE